MSARRSIRTPAQLQRLMRAKFPVSDQQWPAVSAPLEPRVVMAGAGSGKTTLMAARVVYLVASGQVASGEVLGLTFTTKAASELLDRVLTGLDNAGLLGTEAESDADSDGDGEATEPTVSTYNAYAASLLTEQGLLIGLEPDTRVMADASRYQLAARVIEEHRGMVTALSDHPATVIKWMLQLESTLSEHLVTPEELRTFDDEQWALFDEQITTVTHRREVNKGFSQRREALALVEEYRAAKDRFGLMDFSDQIAWAAQLAERHPVVGQAERERFKVVLLDEYQDTSVGQARMLKALFGPGSGRSTHAVMAVGDPNQAIYGWRGASVSNITGFASDFPRGDGQPVATDSLTINYRSDKRILDVANAIAAPLYADLGHVAALMAGTDREGDVDVIVHETRPGELEWLTEQVRAAHQSGEAAAWSEIAVLARDNEHAAEAFDTLTEADIPVEIVGLSGLLRLPEISEVVCTLTLLEDLTANAALLTLLAGPRWCVGQRDLALLGTRATRLAAARAPRERLELREELRRAVAGADPSEVVALIDALDDPGDELDYSKAALERFELLSRELRELRRHSDEPLTEIVRRIVDTCGIETELAASSSAAADSRRDNLDLFVQAVADFQAVDGAVTLTSLMAWLEAEDQYGQGLDAATPSEADSVKLLTIHRAKGLEWDVVFCVGVCGERFPNKKSRGIWPTRTEILPTPLRGDRRDLPALTGHTGKDIKALVEATKSHQLVEENRLAYVAFTRARHRLFVSSYVWRAGRKGPHEPSEYQCTIRDTIAAWDRSPLGWTEQPEDEALNPLDSGAAEEYLWPVTEPSAEMHRRAAAAALVAAALERSESTDVAERAEVSLTPEHRGLVAEWDEDLEHLLAEAAAEDTGQREVAVPTRLSTSALQRLAEDPQGFASELARPMPRQPSESARFGTRFHAWVEGRIGQAPLLDPDDLWGRADAGIEDDDDLDQLIARFESSQFADRVPHSVEAPFSLVLAGRVIRGVIDAVYSDGDGWLLVDWKTNRTQNADPVQLAVYRLAWAELHDVEPESVRTGFYYVRSGDLVEPALPSRDELEAVLRVDP